MGEAVGDRRRRGRVSIVAIHRLEEKAFEVQGLEARGIDARLGMDQLQLLPRTLRQGGARLGTDADPVDARRRRQGAVGLDRDRETPGMKGRDKGRIELKQRLAARADHQRLPRGTYPGGGDGLGKVLRRGEPSPALSIHPHEIGVAEASDRAGPINLAP